MPIVIGNIGPNRPVSSIEDRLIAIARGSCAFFKPGQPILQYVGREIEAHNDARAREVVERAIQRWNGRLLCLLLAARRGLRYWPINEERYCDRSDANSQGGKE